MTKGKRKFALAFFAWNCVVHRDDFMSEATHTGVSLARIVWCTGTQKVRFYLLTEKSYNKKERSIKRRKYFHDK